MEKITARANEKIKHAVRLGESASLRKEEGEFFLEGARLCFDAVQTGIEIKQAFFTAKALWKRLTHDVARVKIFNQLLKHFCISLYNG